MASRAPPTSPGGGYHTSLPSSPASRINTVTLSLDAKSYRLVKQIGQGGFGKVWKAAVVRGDPAAPAVTPGSRDDYVAIKELYLPHEEESRKAMLRSARREYEISVFFESSDERRQACRSVALCASAIYENLQLGFVAIVFPLGFESTVQDFIAEFDRTRASREQRADFVALGRALTRGLDALHSLGVAHRDLKPSNILINNFAIRFIDFAFSCASESDELTCQTDDRRGDTAYVDQELRRASDFKTVFEREKLQDVHALGLILAQVASPVVVQSRRRIRDATGAIVLNPMTQQPFYFRLFPRLEEIIASLRATAFLPAALVDGVVEMISDFRQRQSAAYYLRLFSSKLKRRLEFYESDWKISDNP